jgi:hypothetical protein
MNNERSNSRIHSPSSFGYLNEDINDDDSSSTSSTSSTSNLKEHARRLTEERDTLLKTGVYSTNDSIIIELDKRIRECLKGN